MTWLLPIIISVVKKDNKLNAWTKQNIDFCGDGNLGDGDSPLVDVEEAVASIPADILDQPPDSTPQASQVPATTVASPESVSEFGKHGWSTNVGES